MTDPIAAAATHAPVTHPMRTALKWTGIALGSLIVLALAAATAFALIGRSRLNDRYEVSPTLASAAVNAASLEEGERIIQTRGCVECHGEQLGGTVFLDIPPGRIVAPNLTRGRGGVGARYPSLDDWNRAVRFGVRPDGRLILPFMPYEFYNRLSDVDAASVAAYLASLPPIDSELPPTELRIPGYVMMGLPGMNPVPKLAGFSAPRTTPPPGPTAEFGRYVASTTCAACHGEDLRGGPNANPEGPPGPELSHAGQWSLEEFTTAMRTGVRPDGVQVSDWMPWKHLRHLTDEQLRAVHEYLKTVTP